MSAGGRIVVVGRGDYCLVRLDPNPPRALGEIAGRADEAFVLQGEYDGRTMMNLARDYLARRWLTDELCNCSAGAAIADLKMARGYGWRHLTA